MSMVRVMEELATSVSNFIQQAKLLEKAPPKGDPYECSRLAKQLHSLEIKEEK